MKELLKQRLSFNCHFVSSSGKGKTTCGWSAVAATEHCAQENPWSSDHQGSRRNFCWTCGHWGGNEIQD